MQIQPTHRISSSPPACFLLQLFRTCTVRMANPTRTPSSASEAVHVLINHYDELHKVLSVSPQTLESLANKYYQAHYIDLLVKSSITDSMGHAGAGILLDHLILKVEQSSDYLPSVISIMGLEVALINIVQKMDSCRKTMKLTNEDRLVTAGPIDELNFSKSVSGCGECDQMLFPLICYLCVAVRIKPSSF